MIAERIERLDLEIGYRLSTTQSNLQAVSAQPKPVTDPIRKQIRQAVGPLFAPASEKMPPLYPEFASYSGLALIAELRRHVNPGEKERLNKVITALSGLNGELDDASSRQSADATLVAAGIISTMGEPRRWNLGFFYADCSKDKPFC